ncbi:MAG: hypothetical protein WD490_08260 [Opitutales bacterium]
MYFIKPPYSFDVIGPFSLLDIKRKLTEKEIRPDFEAVEATGQSFGKLRRSADWRRVDTLINLEDDQWDEISEKSAGNSDTPKTHKYPALETLIQVHYFFACIIGIAAASIAIAAIANEGWVLFLGVMLVATFLILILISTGELIRLFIDIERNTREKRDALTDR